MKKTQSSLVFVFRWRNKGNQLLLLFADLIFQLRLISPMSFSPLRICRRNHMGTIFVLLYKVNHFCMPNCFENKAVFDKVVYHPPSAFGSKICVKFLDLLYACIIDLGIKEFISCDEDSCKYKLFLPVLPISGSLKLKSATKWKVCLLISL